MACLVDVVHAFLLHARASRCTCRATPSCTQCSASYRLMRGQTSSPRRRSAPSAARAAQQARRAARPGRASATSRAAPVQRTGEAQLRGATVYHACTAGVAVGAPLGCSIYIHGNRQTCDWLQGGWGIGSMQNCCMMLALLLPYG